ncbi:MAG: NAD(P)-dependent alcohol dehydrogenase [Actinobacteria bacterium]|nr:NAD(P)-dependent alcohol dehydrogenase [Actinomycetota bacterium]
MKAIIWTRYGPPDVLQLREVRKPIPTDNQVRIKIHSATVTAGDCETRGLKLPFYISLPMRLFFGPVRPKRVNILGQELAGEIESVGKAVSKFKKGDKVFANTGFGMGAYSEYICLPEKPQEMSGIVLEMPLNISYEEAAAVPLGGLEALHFIRKANIQKGQEILINGAGGSIGTYAVQLAKYFGAEVTAVDSTGKLDMLRSIGADYTLDYTKKDFTQSGKSYDIIFDVIGKSPFSGTMRSLKPNGLYLIANAGPLRMIRGALASMKSNKKVIFGAANPKIEDLMFLKDLIEAGKIKAVIDRKYPFEQIVEAHRYVEKGNKKGNVVIAVQHNNEI